MAFCVGLTPTFLAQALPDEDNKVFASIHSGWRAFLYSVWMHREVFKQCIGMVWRYNAWIAC